MGISRRHLWLIALGVLSAAPAPAARATVTRELIASAFTAPLRDGEFPLEIATAEGKKARVDYTIDARLQNEMARLFERYKPDYGAFVAVDAENGAILSLVSYTRRKGEWGNLALRAMFPSASVIKIVTASAAIDSGKATPDTVIQFRGGNHTLYKRNLSGGGRHMTLKEAFARSVNNVFARLGLLFLKPFELEEYGRRFLFNQAIASDLPLEPGTFSVPGGDRFGIAQIASGFNRESLLSPVHGALLAASIANDGRMMEPHLVRSLADEAGEPLYRAVAHPIAEPLSAVSAQAMRDMMHETVVRGTGRKSFRRFLGKQGKSIPVELGGKTGSLTSKDPAGKCDWYVGYARDAGSRIAVAALTVNEKKWRVKSAFLARSFLERYWQTHALP